MSRDLRDMISQQLDTGYDMLKRDRFGLSREQAAEWVLGLLQPYLDDRVIQRNRGVLSRSSELLGRFYYLRAAALQITGDNKAAREAYEKAYTLFKSCDEKELCDGLDIH